MGQMRQNFAKAASACPHCMQTQHAGTTAPVLPAVPTAGPLPGLVPSLPQPPAVPFAAGMPAPVPPVPGAPSLPGFGRKGLHRKSARPQPLPPAQSPKCRLAFTRDAMCSRGNAGARVAACLHQGLTARRLASLRPCNACQWRRSSRSQRRSLLCNRSQRLSCPACNHRRRLPCRPRQSPSRKFRRSTHTARRTAACLTPGRRCCTSTPRRLRPPLPALLHQSKWRSGRRRRAIAASRTSTVAIVPAESVACSAHLRISERVPLQCSLSQIAEHICRPAPMQLHEL